MNIPLSPRLAACAKCITPGSRIADVGCDHGYLGLHLLHTGVAAYIYAADINEGPLQAAVRNAEKFGYRDKMSFYLSDGLRNVPHDFDCLVCAGMGGDTMVSILRAAPWLKSEKYSLVLQCQTKTPVLRRYLSENGWYIDGETVLRDGKFLYTVMAVSYAPEKERLSVGGWYFPPVLAKNTTEDTAAHFRYILNGLHIAAAHKTDPELHQALHALQTDPVYQSLNKE